MKTVIQFVMLSLVAMCFATTANASPREVYLTIASNKTAICAGGVDSAVHQATITASLKDANKKPIKDAEIHFSLTNSNAKYPARLGKPIVATNAEGKAIVVLTSSRLIGATAKVQASFQRKSATTDSITCGKPISTFTTSPKKWWADGFSVYNMTFTLTFNGQPVDGHNIAWSITKFKVDYNDKIIKNPDADYGKIIYSDDKTDWSSGINRAEILTGWYGGTVFFGIDDKTALEGKEPVPVRYVFTGGIG